MMAGVVGGARQVMVLCYVMAVVLLGYTGLTHWSLTHHHHLNHASITSQLLPQEQTSHNRVKDRGTLEESHEILFFNRVPKTGSEMLVLLLQWLQGHNSFRHYRLRNSHTRHLTKQQQEELLSDIKEKVTESDMPRVSFDRHVHFTNLTTLGLKMPALYFNLIRDPVEKMASRFYYARVTPRPGAATPAGYHPPAELTYTNLEECVYDRDHQCTFITGQHYDLTIPYFCGHQRYCRELNNEAALQQARHNVETWYPVVGVLEDINATLTVLQHKLPHYFNGVLDLYYNDLMAPHHNKNWHRPKTTPEVEAILRKNLTLEYEFYNFVRQRLNEQYQELPDT